MAKLSEETLAQGRALLIKHDLKGFNQWIDKNKIRIDKKTVCGTFEKCFYANDTARALKLFEAVFPNIDPVADAAAIYIRLGCALFVFLGLLGGVMYLLRSCAGS